MDYKRNVLPQPETPFKGKVGFTVRDSVPDWPEPVKAPAGAPNIVLILLDDVGFGAASTFGGPALTPELDRLAARGLRYNRFHVPALCSPTRAALLSGRNDHRIGFGTVTGAAKGFPGYNGIWNKNAVSVAEVLRRNGYSTAAFGKWHNTPSWEKTPVGPFDRWPTGLGFEHFYGIMAGADSQWEPTLYRNTTLVEPPATPEQGYHFNIDIANEAIAWTHTHESLAPEKPYFLYFAPGATHAPHHVHKEWIEKYRGKFDQGWDKAREEIFARQKKLGVIPADAGLTPRPKEIAAWDSLSNDEKKICARQMEVAAAFLAQTDHEVGRLLKTVEQGPGGANTLILYIVGDNGADGAAGRSGSDYLVTSFGSTYYGANSPESLQERLGHMDELGGPQFNYNQYATGWAWAMCTPFQWMKLVGSHFGGTRNPLVASWPARIKDSGAVRSQFTHVNDVAATLCEAAGIPFPSVVDGVKQLPLDGLSFAYTFDRPGAPSRHRLQIFEQADNRAIYKDGWVAAALHWVPGRPLSDDYSQDRWELYNIETDFSEDHDLAAEYPGKLKALRALFEKEALKNNIYPLRGTDATNPPSLRRAHRREFFFHPDLPPLLQVAAPNFAQSHCLTANVTIPDEGAEGVLVSDGGRMEGFVLYVKDNRLVYENHFAETTDKIISSVPLPRGKAELAYRFVMEGAPPHSFGKWGSGTGSLHINGRKVGEGRLRVVSPINFGIFIIGQARISTVSSAYRLPFKFTGTLESVRVELMSVAPDKISLGAVDDD